MDPNSEERRVLHSEGGPKTEEAKESTPRTREQRKRMEEQGLISSRGNRRNAAAESDVTNQSYKTAQTCIPRTKTTTAQIRPPTQTTTIKATHSEALKRIVEWTAGHLHIPNKGSMKLSSSSDRW